MPDRSEIEVPPCGRWECYEERIWRRFWQVVTMLLGVALAIAIVTIASGCAFSVPVVPGVRCDVRVEAELVRDDGEEWAHTEIRPPGGLAHAEIRPPGEGRW